jgi:DTW domain-containing protein YfiP
MIAQRDLCPGCLKARLLCYCQDVRPFATRARFVILQHPLERKRSVGSARIAYNCATNSRLIQGASFEDHPEVRELMADPALHCVVLFPGPKSHVLVVGEPPALPPGRQLVVFVVDGTWPLAKTMLYRSPTLMSLPQICFPPGGPESEYGFRAQPAPHCLSTLEAIHRLVGLLEPEVDASILLELFRRMVREQTEYGKLARLRPNPARRN